MTPDTHTASLNGHPFHIRTWGADHLLKLLMLHGFPEYGGAWGDLAECLSDQFHCIAPDQRGYGQSWAPPDVSDYTTSKLVGDMVALIGDDAPITVLGHDWGAAVAYGLAMFRPDLVKQLIIMNGVHPVPFQRAMASGGAQSAASQYINTLRAAGSENALAADDFARMKTFFQAKMTSDWLTEGILARYVTEWSRPGKLRTMIHWYRASPLLVANPGSPIAMPDLPLDKLMVRCPHLLIWGNDDTALLPESTDGLEAFAPDLTRVDLPDCDHWLHHQKPRVVAQTIKGWMAKH